MIRVLIVDDHAVFRGWARLALSAGGFEVVAEAGGGAEALIEARRVHPDVVLLDVQLPDADGFKVAKELAAQPHPPSIVMTSTRDASAYQQDLERSCLRFVAKVDLSPATIRAALGEVA